MSLQDLTKEFYGANGDWLKASELEPGGAIVKIEGASIQDTTDYDGNPTKQIVLEFDGRLFGLNKTQWKAVNRIAGEPDTLAQLEGVKLHLFKGSAPNGKDTIDVREVAQPAEGLGTAKREEKAF